MSAQAHPVTITPGARFAHYDIVSQRWAGEVSDVWIAVRESTSQLGERQRPKLALKVLQPRFALDEGERARFAREAAIHSTLKHPSIVQCLDAGTAFLALEYVEGVTSRELLDAEAPCGLPPGIALSVVAGVCDALDYVHGNDLVHGDVSSENVMLDGAGGVKLLDFGRAVVTPAELPAEQGSGSRETLIVARRDDSRLRRLQYTSPERIEGTPRDRRSDVYAVGALLFELLHGAPPFEGRDLSDLVSRICAGDTRAWRQDLAPEIVSLVTGAMQVDPETRVQTARAFAARARALGACRVEDRDALGRYVQRAIGLGAPVLDLDEEPPDTLRPAPGTDLDRKLHDLVRATSTDVGEAAPAAKGDPSGAAPRSAVADGAYPPVPADVFTRATRSASPTTDVFGAFGRRRLGPARVFGAPAARTPRAEAAALEFERGWRALRAGRRTEALAAWEAALALDPDNETYAVDVRNLRKKLLQ